jgi:hypothetical protein
MELTFVCPACDGVNRVAGVESAATLTCRGCGRERPAHIDAFAGGDLAGCAACATGDLYIQKDFPHGLGLAIVIAGFAGSTLFWYYYMPISATLVLLATAGLDLLLYYLVPDVTICYRCLAQYRGPGSNPGGRFGPFDLAIGERYRQEKIRVEELRRRGAVVGQEAGDRSP